jgi:hypothetical protein
MKGAAGVLGVMAALWLACQCGAVMTPNDCVNTTCLRAIRCVHACGDSSAVQIGCCPCPMGSFDDIGCVDAGATPDAGSDGG